MLGARSCSAGVGWRATLAEMFIMTPGVITCSAWGWRQMCSTFAKISIITPGAMSRSAEMAKRERYLRWELGEGGIFDDLLNIVDHYAWSNELLGWDGGEGGHVPLLRWQACHLQWWVSQVGWGRGTFAEMLLSCGWGRVPLLRCQSRLLEQHISQVGEGRGEVLCWDVDYEASYHQLTLKPPPIICSRRQFQILPLYQK